VQPEASSAFARNSAAALRTGQIPRWRPELVVEIATTSTSLDLDRKLHAYQRHGVREYIVWSTGDAELYWFVWKKAGSNQTIRTQRIIRSRQFPGLHLAAMRCSPCKEPKSSRSAARHAEPGARAICCLARGALICSSVHAR
jgi:hypothetical protein